MARCKAKLRLYSCNLSSAAAWWKSPKAWYDLESTILAKIEEIVFRKNFELVLNKTCAVSFESIKQLNSKLKMKGDITWFKLRKRKQLFHWVYATPPLRNSDWNCTS